jgi:hypothetical protein
VGALGVVELQRAGERLEHALGDSPDVAALEAGVVRDAHAGEDGDLLAAQSGNAARAVGGQPDLVWGDPGPSGGQELADLGLGVHTCRLDPPGRTVGDPASTPINRGCLLLGRSVIVWRSTKRSGERPDMTEMTDIQFDNGAIKMAGNLYFPDGFDDGRQLSRHRLCPPRRWREGTDRRLVRQEARGARLRHARIRRFPPGRQRRRAALPG